jgi:hypothetical protein
VDFWPVAEDPTATQVVALVQETADSWLLRPAGLGVAARRHDVPFHVRASVNIGMLDSFFDDSPTAVHAAAAVQETPRRFSLPVPEGLGGPCHLQDVPAQRSATPSS